MNVALLPIVLYGMWTVAKFLPGCQLYRANLYARWVMDRFGFVCVPMRSPRMTDAFLMHIRTGCELLSFE